MEISGSDEWQRISRPTGMATASAGAGETFGPRLQRILSYIGFTRTTDIDVGTIPLQPTDLSTKPVEEIATTAASEGGSVWVGADGTLIGRRRYALVEDPRSVNIQAVYGDGGAGEIPWEDIDVSPLSADNVINSATYTAVGGLPQSAQDASSIALYGEIGDQASWSSSLICQNDSDVAVLAAWTVQLNKDPTAKVNSITLKPRASAVALIPTILGATIRDLIEIRRRPPSATSHTLIRDCFISGIAVTVESGDIDVVLSLSPASTYRIYAGSHFDSALFGASDIDPAGARFFS